MEKAQNIEKGLSFGQVIERMKRFKGEAALRAWGDKKECVFLVTHHDLCTKLGYGYGEVPGTASFGDALCKYHESGELEMGWRPSYAEMASNDWQFVNCGERDDIYRKSNDAGEAGKSRDGFAA
ncbi:putative thymidylate kinase [Erwinia phage vB_EamM_RisingSun]|uniref:Putative thymidylate kinase n=2 Tax=Risingsunvirus risingsun TaxID=2560435 RepID=A0A223LII1_9CAUD|nr:putative thymidylate kinase [Erwinia phage vB_EamM_RisingSun]ASU03663.1 putative thymidylate kinase [Erwinia phage vB_EamM_RisingSun]ASU03908.1 putative thymidylate kinase [Erwinia phage vB_EamM_Joad]